MASPAASLADTSARLKVRELWLPSSRAASILRMGNPEVIVVLGNSRQLRKAVGAGGWFF
jgi:hypothetical protein